MKEYDLIIVGGGAAGILCAIEASKQIDNILLIEKDPVLGGMLNLGDFNISKNDNICGKEYKERIMKLLDESKVDIKLETMAIKIEENNEVLCTSKKCGYEKIKGKNIILANGQKEGSRKALSMLGDRCSGILTTGMVKKIFTLDNIIPGKNILIDGDDTLYMIQHQLKDKNINIVGIISKNDDVKTYDLTTNIYRGYEIVSINGEGRVSSVVLKKDDKEEIVKCDTLLFANPMLSDGLVAKRSAIVLNPNTTGPKVDDRFMTSKEGVYACGNGIYIHKFIEDIEKECIELVKGLI